METDKVLTLMELLDYQGKQDKAIGPAKKKRNYGTMCVMSELGMGLGSSPRLESEGRFLEKGY